MVEALKSGPHFGVGGYGRGSEMAWMPADHMTMHMTQPIFCMIFWSLTQLWCARLRLSMFGAGFSLCMHTAQSSPQICARPLPLGLA